MTSARAATPLIDRRRFLAGAGAAFAAGLPPRPAAALQRADALFAAACKRADGSFGCAVFTERGALVAEVDLPDRGHDVAFDPVGRCAVTFARRPRTFAVVFDPFNGRVLHTIEAAAGRHFFGHGFFSPDGRLLYATENAFDAARGLIGVYDAGDGFSRIGEFDTHGMDTHEALLMPDGRTIAVANGGIETHPNYGRQKLNLSTMEPSLVFIDRDSGDLLEKHRLPAHLHQLSIRHLAVAGRDTVWFGCQYEGPAADAPQLVGSARPGRDLRLAELAPTDLASLSNYVGSVAASRDGERVAVSSPAGNTVLVLHASLARIESRHRLADGCGLAPTAGAGFLATSGRGAIAPLPERPGGARPGDMLWDNHVLALTPEA